MSLSTRTTDRTRVRTLMHRGAVVFAAAAFLPLGVPAAYASMEQSTET